MFFLWINLNFIKATAPISIHHCQVDVKGKMKIKLMGEWAQIAGKKEVMLMYDPSNIRSLFIRLEIEYPCGKWDQAVVAINGTLYTDHTKMIDEDDEVCVMPHIEGG